MLWSMQSLLLANVTKRQIMRIVCMRIVRASFHLYDVLT